MAGPTQGRSGTAPQRSYATPHAPHAANRTLHARDRHELEVGSGIHPDVIAERGAFTCPDRKTARLLGFSKPQREVIDVAAGDFALMLPVHTPSGTVVFHQMRPHVARMVKGRVCKYDQPAGVKMAIDSPPRCHAMLGNPKIPMIFTEGIKKGDAAASRGMCAAALIGVFNFRGTNDDGGKTVVADLEDIALNERVTLIVFDSDVMRKHEVYTALDRFSGVLKRRGAEVLYVYLPSGPNGEKVGLDDWLAADPTRGFDDLMRLSTTQLIKPVSSLDPRVAQFNKVVDVLPDAPVDGELVAPLGYEIGMGGVSKIQRDRRSVDALEERRIEVSDEPVVIGGRLEDINDGSQSLVLYHHQAKDWKRQVVSRGVAMDARKLVNLSDRGFPVTSGLSGMLVEYLGKFEKANIDRLPCARVSSQLGWQGQGGKAGFLLGRALVRAGEEEASAVDVEDTAPQDWGKDWISFRGADHGDEQIASGFHAAGTLEGWYSVIDPVVAYPRVLFGLYCSFVPPMLPILDAANFVVDYSYRTSTGKTTTLRVCASPWGNPNDRAGDTLIGSWDSTRVYIERAAAVQNTLALFLDETKRARHPRVVAQTLYDVTHGRGRGRGTPTGMARAGSWQTVLFSTGEAPATSFTEDGGTRARVLSLFGMPFGSDDAATAATVVKLNTGLSQHYGHAGRVFVKYLVDNREKWAAWREAYRARRAHYMERAGGNAVANRMGDYFAAIDTTAELVHEALDMPWEYASPVDPLWDDLTAEATEADPPRTPVNNLMLPAAGFRAASLFGGGGGSLRGPVFPATVRGVVRVEPERGSVASWR